MYLLDNFVKNKFLDNISLLINKYQISPDLSLFGRFLQFLRTSELFNEEIFEIYTEYYKKHFIILELLAGKQELDTQRQVFNLVRNHISKKNIKLNLSDITNIFISHNTRRVIITPEIESPAGLYFKNPK